MNRIGIVDYGMGNLTSVLNAFVALGADAAILRKPEEADGADRLVLPGVGAFGDGMANLKRAGWIDVLEREVRGRGKPFLGICLGMQLLATEGTEHGVHGGLNWIPGRVERLEPGDASLRVPHIGWNDVRFEKKDGLYAGLGDSGVFYFVHSFALKPNDPSAISGLCAYGVEFAASVEVGNIAATQFHPEKSQKAGLRVLRNFVGQAG
jgi:imidazole glycerol-phosphate synthase subunit HisH